MVLIGSIYNCGRCNEWHVSAAGGVIIGEKGLILTNYHVVDPGSKEVAVGVQLWDGRMLDVLEVLAADEFNDIALLRVDAEDLKPLALAKGTKVGEEVFAISHPVEQYYTFTTGIISGKTTKIVDDRPLRQLSITADFAKGSSGCPVLNSRGEVVGLVRATNATYYDRKKGVPSNIQMVWKYLVPSVEIRQMLTPLKEPGKKAEKQSKTSK